MATSSNIPPRPGTGAARRQAAAKQKSKSGGGPWLLIGGLAALVAAVLVIAVLATGGDDPTESATTEDASGLQQTREITVEGDALDPQPAGSADPMIGQAVPAVSGATFNGIEMTLPPTGTPTLLTFLAHWCPHCQAEVPLMTQWEADGKFPDGVEIFAVSTSVSEPRGNFPPSDWLAREEFPFAVMADSLESQAAAAFGVDGFPAFVMIDAEGKVAWRSSGEVPMEELTAVMQATLDGTAIPAA